MSRPIMIKDKDGNFKKDWSAEGFTTENTEITERKYSEPLTDLCALRGEKLRNSEEER